MTNLMNPVVEQLGQIHFEGNITPHCWYQSPRLQNEKGKPNLVAITLLADIVYWYRPIIVRDETSGQEIARRQKFAADKLQKNYEKWSEVFGLTKRQVEDAMAFLKASGLVTVETRAVVTEYGTFPNCAFIEPVLDVIKEMTFPSPEKTGDRPRKNGTYLPKNREAPPEKTGAPSLKNGRRLPENRDHSKTSSETTPKNKQRAAPTHSAHSSHSSPAPTGVLPAAVSREEKKDKAGPPGVSNPWPFDLLSEEEKSPWLEAAETELRENFGLAAWLKTAEKAQAGIRAQRAGNLYLKDYDPAVKKGKDD